MSNRVHRVAALVVLVAMVPFGGCGEEGDDGSGPGNEHSAVVRFEMTPDNGSPFTIADVPMVFHSLEDLGGCTGVLYDAVDDQVWGTDSYAQFQIWSTTCYPVFDGGINGYSFLGEVNPAIVQAKSLSDLSAEQIPFATGYYSRTDNPNVTGTFEFWVDEVMIP